MNRSKPLQARTPLGRNTPLMAKTGLSRSVPMQRKGPGTTAAKLPPARRGFMSSAVALVLAGEATVAEAARRFGVDRQRLADQAWADAKVIVLMRDDYACVSCGGKAVDVHHRVRRGMSGTSNTDVSHSPSNLVALCRADHDLAHRKDTGMHDRGLWLTTDQDPAEVPVYIRSEWGYERFWLLPNGELSRTDQRRAEAA